ncbi:MAG: ABC transporter permease [Planctomycetes bacterium]|nr:ABC transporter permease [Planctomycetota bacterium]
MDRNVNTPINTSTGWLKSIAWAEILGNYGAQLVFLTLIAACALSTPKFFSLGTLEITLLDVFPVMLVALGMTLVISSGGIDISVGAIMAISGAVTVALYTSGVGWVLSMGCGIGAAALCGLFNGVLISIFRIQPIIVTLVVMIAGRGLARRIQVDPTTSLKSTPFDTLGLYRIAGKVPVQIVIMLAVIAVMLFVVKKTVFAKNTEAIGDNPRAARLVGVNTLTTTVGVYVVCGVLCAIAGIMTIARIAQLNAVTLGGFIELDAIAAVAIGGTPFSGGRARILGTITGAIIVILVGVIVGLNKMPDDYAKVFKALIIVIAMWAQRRK